MTRQIVLDTETTGLSAQGGDRIIELGCVELVSRKLTGNNLHLYFNPGRDSHEDALKVHGISNEFLRDKPRFADCVQDILDYLRGAELIIHNASFDVGFLDYELSLAGKHFGRVTDHARVLDTLAMARERYPGQRNSLDALCRRLGVDNAHRKLHGALLDAELLAEVYLGMTSGQGDLGLAASGEPEAGVAAATAARLAGAPVVRVLRRASAAEEAAHAERLAKIAAKAGRILWPGTGSPA